MEGSSKHSILQHLESWMVLLTNFRQCTMGVYPFMFGSVKDFEPVVEDIIKVCDRIQEFDGSIISDIYTERS